MKKKNRRLFVLSIDAWVCEDVEYVKNLPNFKKILDGSSWIKKVETVYPSLTYPCHVSMCSGVWPDKHGIYNNEIDDFTMPAPTWNWYSKDIKVKTIFDMAKKAGYTTAAVHWPVQCGNKKIDYLVPEIWMHEGCGAKDYAALLKKHGANASVLEIAKSHFDIYNGDAVHPRMDNFAMACACDIIEKYAPEVMFVHDARVDGARHSSGIFTDKVNEALQDVDKWLGKIIKAMEKAGVYEQTDIVLTSDHGQINIVRSLSPNVVFADNGLITVDEEGKVVDYKAYIKSAALSAQVFLKDPENEDDRAMVYSMLNAMCKEGIYGISRVLTKEEAKEQFHLEGKFEFVIETDGYTTFGDSWLRPIVGGLTDEELFTAYKYGRATHGHMPKKGPQPTVVFKGPHFAKGVTIENGVIVDQAPTYAKLLGFELPDADGKAIESLIVEEIRTVR